MSLIQVREYATAEEMINAYRKRKRKMSEAVQNAKEINRLKEIPIVLQPVDNFSKEWTIEVDDRRNARALDKLPAVYRGIRVRRAARMIFHANETEPRHVIGPHRVHRRWAPAYRGLIVFLRRKEIAVSEIGRLLDRDHTSILHQLRLAGWNGATR